ncbi:ribonuclease-3 [Thermocrinis minervae]|uniref:Ribonuclease 3 n=2 Tax=Thermocrinis minervae TaxID=381751 RepID=A0A1M6R2Z9_9AQUI|nr:ribonuclease-3 [Thermocrinis minervae]
MHASSLEKYEYIEKVLGYTFKDKSILQKALTHKSYSEEGMENYETLEFLGDSLVNLFVVDVLFSEFPKAREGELAQMKAYFISEDFLGELAHELRLDEYVLVGGKKKEKSLSIIADTFEALWAAVYLDSGKDLNFVRQIFERLYKDRIVRLAKENKHRRDYKTMLQEYTQKKWKERPTYRLVSVSGNDNEKVFHVECTFRDYRAIGVGRNKKEAEQDSARKLLEMLQMNM